MTDLEAKHAMEILKTKMHTYLETIMEALNPMDVQDLPYIIASLKILENSFSQGCGENKLAFAQKIVKVIDCQIYKVSIPKNLHEAMRKGVDDEDSQ